jgi:aryl-alcohol dehydrogenase-like predicted oxidoreductase
MEYKTLGHSDLQISRIGFGAMSLKMGEEANTRLLHEAITSGINFFDTADLYDKGVNEELIGRALKGRRDQVIIATKVGNQWRPDGSGWDWNPNPGYILDCVEKSLQRLQTDYIDLYQLHGGTLDDPINEVIGTFESLKEKGKIRYYGISSIRPNVIREYVKRSSIVSVMSQYSLLDRRPEETVLQLLKENNIGVLVRGALAQGILVDKPAREYLGQQPKEVEKVAAAVRRISSGRAPAQTAIQFVLHHPAITSAVVGMRTLEQLKEVSEIVRAEKLTGDEYKFLRDIIEANLYELHR